MTKVRVYLDVDGCINAFGHAEREIVWGNQSAGKADVTYPVDGSYIRSYEIKWYPAMIKAFRELDVEIVWLTTWRHNAPSSIGKLVGLGENSRVLHPLSGVTTFPSIYWKTEALIEDQRNNPSPFIWIDDELNYMEPVSRIEEELPESSHLIIAPDNFNGISPNDIDQMQYFVNAEA